MLLRILLTISLSLMGGVTSARQNLDSLFKKTAELAVNGDYAEATKVNTLLLQASEQQGNCHYQCQAMYKAGEMNDLLGNKELTLRYLKAGMNMAIKCDDSEVIWLCTRYLGGYYFGYSNRDSAWHYLSAAYELIKHTNKYARLASTTGMMGETHKQITENIDSAEYYLKISLEYALKSEDYEAMGYACLRYGALIAIRRNNRNGIGYVERSYELFKSHNNIEGIGWSLITLGNVYYHHHEYEKGWAAMNQLVTTKDSIFSRQVAAKTTQYRVLYETEKKEKENALKDILLEAEAKRRHNQLIIFGILFIALSAAFYLIYSRYTFKKKIEAEKQIAEEQLLRFKSVIDAEEKERERIARELHDGVGHLLSSARLNVSAIEDISEENREIVDRAMDIIDEALGETRNISHNLMPAALSELGFASAIKQLVRKIDRAGKIKVTLHNEEAIPIPEQTKAVALYRIVQELLNNALKYSGAEAINIYFRQQEHTCAITVADNGKGFDTSDIKNKGGIGWKNIYSRIEMLNGGIIINSSPGQGARITISFNND